MITLGKLWITVLGSTSLGISTASNYSFPLLDLFPILGLINLLPLVDLLGLVGRLYTLRISSRLLSPSSSSLVGGSVISLSSGSTLVGRAISSN